MKKIFHKKTKLFYLSLTLTCLTLSSYSLPKKLAYASVQTTDTGRPKECVEKLAAQKKDAQKDKFSETETFEKYPVDQFLQKPPAPLDINSNKFAKRFRTRLREDLKKQGVNFAGSYSIVTVPMTGWGKNYFIIDRKNGKAYLFPYHAVKLDFKKDSNLILMNPKSLIMQIDSCLPLGQQTAHDLRSFYFLWKNNQLVLIGPKDKTPPPNEMWAE